MKRLLIGLFIWLLSAQLALAAVTLTNTDFGAFTAPSGSATVTLNSGVGTINTGTAAADRVTAIVLSSYDSTDGSHLIASAVIAGGAATCTANANDTTTMQSIICWKLNTTGTTAVVTVNTGTDCGGNCLIGYSVYSVTGANTTTPISSTNTAVDTSAGTPAASITIPSGGALLAGSAIAGIGSGSNATWTNATFDARGEATLVSSIKYVINSAISSTSGTPTVTANWGSGGLFSPDVPLSLAAFQQASGGGATSDQSLPLTGFGN